MDKLRYMVFYLSGGNRKVFGVVLLSAAYVALARLLAPLVISWDLSIQLEAAHRLVHGLGLTNASSSHFDLNQPPISQYLTHFPPGLALSVAGLLIAGIPLAIALKAMYGLITVAGWIGWASIGAHCLTGPVKIGRFSLPLHLVIAAILPIFYTPSWTIQGTDIFLWAGIPIVILLTIYRPTYKPVDDRVDQYSSRKIYGFIRKNFPNILLGILIGYLIAVRYSSAFLLLAVLLLIAYVDFPRISAVLRRFATVCLSCALILFPMAMYVKLATRVSSANSAILSNNNPLKTHRALSHRGVDSGSVVFASLFESAEKSFSSFSNLYILTGLDSERLGRVLGESPAFDVLGLAFILAVAVSLVGLILKQEKSLSRTRFLAGLLSIVVSFVLFSTALTFILAYSPLQIARYYRPVAFCLILAAYRAAILLKPDDWMKYAKHVAAGLVLTFTLYNLILKPADRLFLDSKSDLMSPVLASGVKISDVPYPSNRILSLHEDSVDYLHKIQLQNPNALFFVQAYALYMSYLKSEDSSRFRRIPDADFWREAYLSEPTQIFWVINNSACSSICASGGNFNSDRPEHSIDVLLTLPNLETVFADQDGSTQVMVSDLPAGYHFDNDLDPS